MVNLSFTKNEFDRFSEKHGTLRLVGHTKRKNHCTCFDGENADPKCHKCFGTGWKYDWFLTKARRSQGSTGISASNDKIDFRLPFDISTLNFKYYFKTECDVSSYDFIIEFMNSEGRDKYPLYFIKNDKLNEGDGGTAAFKSFIANKVLIEQDVMQKALRNITSKDLGKV